MSERKIKIKLAGPQQLQLSKRGHVHTCTVLITRCHHAMYNSQYHSVKYILTISVSSTDVNLINKIIMYNQVHNKLCSVIITIIY